MFVTGRLKDLIIIGGRNYYPQDIERIVCEDPDIIDGRCVALGRLEPNTGTEELIVIGETDSSSADYEIIERRLRTSLAERLDCVMSDLRLVPHMWLLKTSSGKIARRPNLERYLKQLRAGEAKDAPNAFAGGS